MEFIDKAVRYTPYIGAMILGGMIAFVGIKKNDYYFDEVKAYLNTVEDDKGTNEDIYEAYQDYIESVATSISNRHENRNLVYDYAIYLTMLNNGYCSLGNSFEYGSIDVSFKELKGISIALGIGNIENETAHLVDVLTNLGYDARYVVGTVSLEDEEVDNPNYVMCAVNWCSTTFILDVAHKDIYLKSNKNEYSSLTSTEDKIFVPVEEYFDDTIGENKNEDLLKVKKVDYSIKKEVLADFKEYLEDANDQLLYLANYERLFLQDNESNIDDLVKIDEDATLLRK